MKIGKNTIVSKKFRFHYGCFFSLSYAAVESGNRCCMHVPAFNFSLIASGANETQLRKDEKEKEKNRATPPLNSTFNFLPRLASPCLVENGKSFKD